MISLPHFHRAHLVIVCKKGPQLCFISTSKLRTNFYVLICSVGPYYRKEQGARDSFSRWSCSLTSHSGYLGIDLLRLHIWPTAESCALPVLKRHGINWVLHPKIRHSFVNGLRSLVVMSFIGFIELISSSKRFSISSMFGEE